MNSFKPSMNKEFFKVENGVISPKGVSVTEQGFIATVKKIDAPAKSEAK